MIEQYNSFKEIVYQVRYHIPITIAMLGAVTAAIGSSVSLYKTVSRNLKKERNLESEVRE